MSRGMQRWIGLSMVVLAITSPLLAQEKPLLQNARVTGDTSQRRVAFSVSRPTDIEVAVIDARGQVIRHLAAGVLGGDHPPPAPLQVGLAQSIAWDGNNDDGVPATGGPFQVRIRAGMQAKFGRMIGGSPYTGSVVQMPYRAPVNGLATDGQGRLYVKMMSSIGSHGNSGMWPWHLRQFDRNGDYVKSVLPYAPTVSPAQATGYQLIEAGGALRPANQNSLYPVFATFGNEILPRFSAGQMVFVHSEKRELNFFSVDGSNRLRTVSIWPAAAKLTLPRWLDVQVALSPDGHYAYYSNVAGAPYDGKRPADIDANWPQGRIYRQDLAREGSLPERFFDLTLPDFEQQPYWMPSAWDKKTATAGIDTDAQGNVLVCDLVNGQIVEIDPSGKQRSATPVEWPDKVLVNRKTGDLYVISRKVSRGFLPPATLFKITGRGSQAKVVAELALQGTVGGAYTLDESGELPVLWLAGSVEGTDQLLRIEDRGGELVALGNEYLNRDPSAITFVGYMDIDRQAELVYVTRSGGTVWRYDGQTGEGGPLEIKAVDLAIGPSGHIYTWGTDGGYQGPIARFTRDLAPAPLAGSDRHTYGFLEGRAGRGNSVCGLDVDARGRVFATYGSNACHVQAFDERGELIDFPRRTKIETRRGPQSVPVAVANVVGYGGSLRLDRAGNIYVLQHGLPADHVPPAGYEKDEAYRTAVGTIYKFPPAGGEFQQASNGIKEATGAVATYAGCGPVSRWRADGACACTKPRFDVDDYGRLYIPNGITFSVSVRDNAGNEILQFGGYGNYDCQGPQSAQPMPTIPLGWPVGVAASDRSMYVGDCLNHRLVRVDKQYAAEMTLELK